MMSLYTATLVNNAEDAETWRERAKERLEELSGDRSKRLCLADRAKSFIFHVIFVTLKLNALLWWFGSMQKSPQNIFEMGVIFEWHLGLILFIMNAHEVMLAMWHDAADHRWCSVDRRQVFGGGVYHAGKSHLGLIIIRGLNVSASFCPTAAPLLYKDIKTHTVISKPNSCKKQQHHPYTADGLIWRQAFVCTLPVWQESIAGISCHVCTCWGTSLWGCAACRWAGAPAGPHPPATSAGTFASAAASAPGAAAHEDAAGSIPHTSQWSLEAEGWTWCHSLENTCKNFCAPNSVCPIVLLIHLFKSVVGWFILDSRMSHSGNAVTAKWLKWKYKHSSSCAH